MGVVRSHKVIFPTLNQQYRGRCNRRHGVFLRDSFTRDAQQAFAVVACSWSEYRRCRTKKQLQTGFYGGVEAGEGRVRSDRFDTLIFRCRHKGYGRSHTLRPFDGTGRQVDSSKG